MAQTNAFSGRTLQSVVTAEPQTTGQFCQWLRDRLARLDMKSFRIKLPIISLISCWNAIPNRPMVICAFPAMTTPNVCCKKRPFVLAVQYVYILFLSLPSVSNLQHPAFKLKYQMSIYNSLCLTAASLVISSCHFLLSISAHLLLPSLYLGGICRCLWGSD